MLNIPQLKGRPFIFKLDSKVRTLGDVTDFKIDQKRTTAQLTVALTDEEAAGILGAAADKALQANLGEPLSDEEIQDLVHGDEWTGQTVA